MAQRRKQHKNPSIRVAACAMSGNWHMTFGSTGWGIFVSTTSISSGNDTNMTIKDDALEGIVIIVLLASIGLNIMMFMRTEGKIEDVERRVNNLTYEFEEQFDTPREISPKELMERIESKRQ